jgi:hypothetical protein
MYAKKNIKRDAIKYVNNWISIFVLIIKLNGPNPKSVIHSEIVFELIKAYFKVGTLLQFVRSRRFCISQKIV